MMSTTMLMIMLTRIQIIAMMMTIFFKKKIKARTQITHVATQQCYKCLFYFFFSFKIKINFEDEMPRLGIKAIDLLMKYSDSLFFCYILFDLNILYLINKFNVD